MDGAIERDLDVNIAEPHLRKSFAATSRTSTVAERLGYAPTDRLIIVNCDDLGCSRSANRAIESALRCGNASSATLMVPCPWAKIAAAACRDLDIGVHLTLTSEFPAYRWRSLTGGRSLHDKDGYFPRTTHEVWARAELSEIEAECRAQIERALEWGIQPTHLDSHMDTLQLDRHYFDVYLRVASDYRLPIRLRRERMSWPLSYMRQSTVERAGVLTTDGFFSPRWGSSLGADAFRLIATRYRGITELALHPVEDSEELRAYDTEYHEIRVADAEFLSCDATKQRILESGLRLISYRPLRDAMRGLA
jgi:predicted glycoside hydrolase/deacetylase ChbG (UPF0249 family)